MDDSITLARKKRFSSAHLYRQASFTEDQNRETFGRCFSQHGHGHDYVLEVYVAGPMDPATRLVINLTDLDRILANVVEPLEHKHLNFEVPEFASVVPTTENIALYIRGRVLDGLAEFPQIKLTRIRLYETEDLWVELHV